MAPSGGDPVGQREFDQYTRATDRRLDAIEKWQEGHEKAHAEDEGRDERRTRWRWQQVVAWAAVAAVLVAAWWTAASSATAK